MLLFIRNIPMEGSYFQAYYLNHFSVVLNRTQVKYGIFVAKNMMYYFINIMLQSAIIEVVE